MEKTLRVLGGGEEGEDSAHSHSHSHTPAASTASGVNLSPPQNGLRKRNSDPDNSTESKLSSINQALPSASGPSKLSAYLNLFGDFVHNM